MIEYFQVGKHKIFTTKIKEIINSKIKETDIIKAEEEGIPSEDILEICYEAIKEMAKLINVSTNTALAWFKGESFPTSDCIKKIMKEYNLTPDELGVITTEISEESFAGRLKILAQEKGLNNTKLAQFLRDNELTTVDSTIHKWLNGERTPSIDTILTISNIFGVNYLYLLGVIDEKQPTYSSIKKLIGIDEKTSIALLEYKTMSQYGENLKEYIYKKYGFNYQGIVEDIIQNTPFIDSIYFEIYRILEYKLTFFKESFDEVMNTIELDLKKEELGINSFMSSQISTNNYVTQQDISELIITKHLKTMIDKIVEKYEKIAREKGNIPNF